MELVRTLGIAIDPAGAKSGGAAASEAFSKVGKAAKETEGASVNASKALKETGVDMKRTASAGEMLREVLSKQTTILTRIDSSIRKLTAALKDQKQGADALRASQDAMSASTEAATAATERKRRKTAEATSSLAVYTQSCTAATTATSAVTAASILAATGFAALAASAVATSAGYWSISAAAKAAASSTLSLVSVQNRQPNQPRGMLNVTNSAVPLLENSADWRRAHAQYRAYAAQNMAGGPAETGTSSWIVPAASQQLAVIRSIAPESNKSASAIDRLNSMFWSSNSALTSVGKGVRDFVGELTSMQSVVAGISVGFLARDLYQTEVAVQRSSNAMRYASGTSQEFATNQQFIRKVTDGLGLDLLSSSAAFAKLAASAKGTVMEGAPIRDLFLATAKGATAMGLSVDETDGALNAFSQMLSKGTVAAEELRGQLGERLYGAFNMAAKSMGMTTEDLNKFLAEGKIGATELLPALTREMNAAFSADAAKNAHKLQSEMNRLKTEWLDMKTAIMEDGGGERMFSGMIKGAAQFLRRLQEINGILKPYTDRLSVSDASMSAYMNSKGVLGPKARDSSGQTPVDLSLEGASADAIEKIRRSNAENLARAHGLDLISMAQSRHSDEIAKTGRELSRVKDIGLSLDAAQVFTFDKAKIDAAADGMESYEKTMSEVNRRLTDFFGTLDDASAVNFDQMAKIDDELDDFFSDLDERSGNMMTQRSGHRGYQEKQLMSGSFWQDVANSAKMASQEMRDTFSQAKAAGQDMTGALSSGFTNFFDEIVDGTDNVAKSFGRMTASILRDIAKIIIQRTVAEPIAGGIISGLSSALGGFFGGGAAGAGALGSSAGGFTGGYNGTLASTYSFTTSHVGGFVGLTLGSHKLVDPSIFSGAPRLHSGLKPDEFPAILQRGEEVVPRNEVRRRAPVSLSIPINVTVDGSKGGSPQQNERMGAEIGRQLRDSFRAMLVEELQPRGLLNP